MHHSISDLSPSLLGQMCYKYFSILLTSDIFDLSLFRKQVPLNRWFWTMGKWAMCVYTSRTLKLGHNRGLVPATSPMNSLQERTGHRDLSREQFTQSIFRNKSQGPCPKNSTWFEFVEQVPGTKPCDKILKQKGSVHIVSLVPMTCCED